MKAISDNAKRILKKERGEVREREREIIFVFEEKFNKKQIEIAKIRLMRNITMTFKELHK